MPKYRSVNHFYAPVYRIMVVNPKDRTRYLVFPAIIDTGAKRTSFPRSVYDGLGLTSREMVKVRGVLGKSRAKRALVSLKIGRCSEIDHIPVLFLPGLERVALIGHDILSSYTLKFDGPNYRWGILDEEG